jgi:uncharacterized protein
MNAPAVLVATVKVRPGVDTEFSAWKARHDMLIGRFPGFLGSDMIPPTQAGGNEWTMLMNFRTKEDLAAWQSSKDRGELVAEGMPLFEGGSYREIERDGEPSEQQKGSVTEVIFSKIKAGREDDYREWSARMQAEQAKYPGYRGMFLQPPEEAGGLWTTIIRFDTAMQLEKWMNAPERASMLRESKAFIEHEQLTHLATSFPGWVPVDPLTGKGPPDWKTALLVLLGLFPIVMLEMRFLGYLLTPLGVENRSLATFVGNFISVAATSFLTMPLFVRWFGWWLFLKPESPKNTTLKGVLILIALFAIEVIALWKLI